MKKYLLLAILLTFIFTPVAYAQSTFDLTPLTNYQTKGNARILAEGSKYRLIVKAESLPEQIPNNAKYYVIWATIQDGRADNLGTVANNVETSATINGTPKQIFITAEKERFPEYVQGPRLTQTKEITTSELPTLASPTPTATNKPGTSSQPTTSSKPIGQPNDAPNTGLGGTFVFYTFTTALIVFGTIGALVTLRKTSLTK